MKEFELIKQEYDTFIRFLLSKGMLPAKDTGVGFWGITHCQDLFDLFNKIGLYQYKTFADIGSGDGRAVLIASLFNVHATGIEADRWLVDSSTFIRRKIGLPHFKNTRFLLDDFMERDLRGMDVIYCSPDKRFHMVLEEKLAKEMGHLLIVHGYEFQPQMKKDDEFIINGEKFCVYKNEVPHSLR